MTEETRERIESRLEVKSYIQIGIYGEATTFVMSFHFAEKAFTPEIFPYMED